jgi:hypothetical protein
MTHFEPRHEECGGVFFSEAQELSVFVTGACYNTERSRGMSGSSMTEHNIMRLATGAKLNKLRKDKHMDEIRRKRNECFFWFPDHVERPTLFSVLVCTVVMIVLQTLSHGFDYPTWYLDQYLAAKLDQHSAHNRDRYHRSGMTFVIISVGYDLSVGSPLVAVCSLDMMMIDSGPMGILQNLVIT